MLRAQESLEAKQFETEVPKLAGESCWYALQTRCRYEKKVAVQLRDKGIETFLPLVKQVHYWSDRRKTVELPLFPGYAFVRIPSLPECRLRIVETAGVGGFVSVGGKPAPIPERQIEDVQLLLSHEISHKAYPFLKVGQRVRIRGSCLDGLEGILISENKDNSLVVSIEAVQRSLIVRIDGYDVEAV
jgi:transcription antitermination factor NusG